ncbi:MAG: PSP1 domain-containing protein [Bacteroidota bacterium]
MSCNGCGIKSQYNDIDINQLGCGKLDTFDWLEDLPTGVNASDIVEIRFKNTRKEYFLNDGRIPLKKGMQVAVEASPGHDIGIVNLTGQLAGSQMKKKNMNPARYKFKKIYRLARQSDIDKWKEAKHREYPTMVKARQIAASLNLEMKIGDVEYQGDNTKAIFYYIADGRVDFRELIKKLAREFSIRVEMKQIGSRQEAGMIGGIGSCGRELCCSTWRTNFSSVTTEAIRYQELPVNAQKLAGQCGKLKCCLMYELETYLDAREEFPKELLMLETTKGIAYHHKTDLLKKEVWYSFEKDKPVNLTPVSLERVKEIIQLNKKGLKVENLVSKKIADETNAFITQHHDEDITRFDNLKSKSKKKRKKRKNKNFIKKNE